jgi:hypothetical protein
MTDAVWLVSQNLQRVSDGVDGVIAVEFRGLLGRVPHGEILRPQIVRQSNPHRCLRPQSSLQR